MITEIIVIKWRHASLLLSPRQYHIELMSVEKLICNTDAVIKFLELKFRVVSKPDHTTLSYVEGAARQVHYFWTGDTPLC